MYSCFVSVFINIFIYQKRKTESPFKFLHSDFLIIHTAASLDKPIWIVFNKS